MDWKKLIKPTKLKILITIIVYAIFWLYINYSGNIRVVISNSMSPTFNVGDLLFINKQDRDIKINDIIVYDAHLPNPVVSRVIRINADGTYQTKMDNNLGQSIFELSVSKEQVIGKVVYSLPKFGFLFMFPVALVWIIVFYLVSCVLIWSCFKLKNKYT
jgi:signal peptidase